MLFKKKPTFPRDEAFYVTLHGILHGILVCEAPDEADLFMTLGPQLVRNAGEGRKPSDYGLANEFSPVLESGLVATHLVAGTLAFVDIVLHAKRVLKEREERIQLQRQWTEVLVKYGLDPKLASMISEKFTPEILEFVLGLNRDKE